MTTTTTTAPPEVIRVSGVSKRFVIRKDNSLKERLVTLGRLGRRHREEFWALRDVDVVIPAGTTVGLIGHNGSGKSTLLKVVGGIIGPTTGTVSNRGRIAALLELGAGFHPDLTGRENVYLNASILGMSRKETDARFDEIHQFSGIGEFIDTQVKFYSSGMYVRLAFAVAVHTDPDILLVDEVLAVGDEAFQRKCLDTIRRFQTEGRTIVLVSHSLGQIQEFCDRAILLNKGRVDFDGDPREAVSRFRGILEERRVSEESGVPEVESDLRVERVSVVDAVTGAALASSGSAKTGNDLRIDITLTHRTQLTDWMLAVQIDNVHGQKVTGTGSDRVGVDLPPLTGSQTYSFTFSAPMFGDGKYFVNVSVLDLSGAHLKDVPQAVSFTIDGPANGSGPLFAEAALVRSA